MLISLAGTFFGPSAAEAQQAGKTYRIGFLSGTTAVAAKPSVEQFVSGLRNLDYVDGKNIAIEYRWADGRLDRLNDLAIELVKVAPDVIIAVTSQPAMALYKATTTIPIVMVAVGDPVSLGLANSLGRPGKNFTGFTSYGPELVAKQLALLHEVVPHVTRVAVLHNPTNPLTRWLTELQQAARTLRIDLQVFNITRSDDVTPAVEDAVKNRAGAMLVASDQVMNPLAGQITALALSNRLPAMFGNRAIVYAGGLMAYSTDFAVPYRRAAIYIDKILKGARPSDLPIEEPTKFDLVINLKTAKAIGLTIPPAVLLRAEHVIE